MAALIDNPDTHDRDKIRAMDTLGRYSGLEKVAYDPELVGELWRALEAYVSDPDTLDAIRARWLSIVAEYVG